MGWIKKISEGNKVGAPILNSYVRFRSSIYGRVVFIHYHFLLFPFFVIWDYLQIRQRELHEIRYT